METSGTCIRAAPGRGTSCSRRPTVSFKWTSPFAPPEAGSRWYGKTASCCGGPTRRCQLLAGAYEKFVQRDAARLHVGGDTDRAGDLRGGHDRDLFKLVVDTARDSNRAGGRG